MKIVIANNNDKLGIIKDYSDLGEGSEGLMGQIIMELELIKEEIMSIYYGEEYD
jgi:hypothetical protein